MAKVEILNVNGVNVSSGGAMNVSSGATASGITLDGGTVNVLNDGAVSGITMNGGRERFQRRRWQQWYRQHQRDTDSFRHWGQLLGRTFLKNRIGSERSTGIKLP